MILVTGSTGTVGRHVVRLLQRDGHRVRAMTRTPDGRPGAWRADFDDPASLRDAVAGVRAVFLLTAPRDPVPDHDLALLAAARTARVATVVKLSAIGTGERFGGATVGAWHEEAENAVRAAGPAWTILRPSSFASNCMHWAGPVRSGAPVPNLTGPAKQGVIDPADVAAVAVAALTDPAHAGAPTTSPAPSCSACPTRRTSSPR